MLRFNAGPTKGFERYVGAKTTYRLTNTEWFGHHEHPDEVLIQQVTSAATMERVAAWRPRHRERLHVVAEDFHFYVTEVFGHGTPTNGFYGTVLADAICRRATLFGFAKGWRGQNVKYHYYDGYNPTNTQESRDTAEGRRQPEMVDAINLIANADAAWVRWAESVGWAHGKLTFGEDIVRDFPSGF